MVESAPSIRRAVAIALCALAAQLVAMPLAAQRAHGESSCDASIPALGGGYGTDGRFAMEQGSAPNPEFRRGPITVFFPQGAEGKRPVVFFSHGFGPGIWEAYRDLISHMVSRGYVVVYSTYPVIGATLEQRYDDLWSGFQAAVSRFVGRMDLTRVAFVGHSFGGGATPAMAYRGVVQQGWGSAGAFTLALAPWYTIGMSDAQLRAIPPRVIEAAEVYDHDTTNDPRMAIDLYDHSAAAQRYYFVVHSATVGGCALTADHSTPGRNESLRQKQYGVFRLFDALADAAFGNAGARDSLAAMAAAPVGAAYAPLRLVSTPVPDDAGRSYQYPWNGAMNPRRNQSP